MTMETKDHLTQRCPRLGSVITFGYCRTCGDDHQPCFKIFDCWWEYFDVVSYLKSILPEAQFKALRQAMPKPKVTSLVEMIEQARKNISS